jgi:hypothetical protein
MYFGNGGNDKYFWYSWELLKPEDLIPLPCKEFNSLALERGGELLLLFSWIVPNATALRFLVVMPELILNQ